MSLDYGLNPVRVLSVGLSFVECKKSVRRL
ncbi:MAG: hypothetical protein [Malazfec virus 1]